MQFWCQHTHMRVVRFIREREMCNVPFVYQDSRALYNPLMIYPPNECRVW